MTITQVADKLGTTPVTIYRRLKRNNVRVEDLRDGETGELTQAGASIIASFFKNQGVTLDEQTAAQDESDETQRDDTGLAAVLQARLDGMTALIEQLTSERDALREQLAAAQAALAAEQADRQSERRLLVGDVADDEPPKRRGLFGWFRR